MWRAGSDHALDICARLRERDTGLQARDAVLAERPDTARARGRLHPREQFRSCREKRKSRGSTPMTVRGVPSTTSL